MTVLGTRWTARSGHRWLVGVLGLVAANAVYGGVGLMTTGLGMPDDWLEPLPVSTWTWPGVALLATVAVPQAGAAALVAGHHPRARAAALLAGAGLVAWIAVQVLVLRRSFVLQPVVAACGVVEVLLARAWDGGVSAAAPTR